MTKNTTGLSPLVSSIWRRLVPTLMLILFGHSQGQAAPILSSHGRVFAWVDGSGPAEQTEFIGNGTLDTGLLSRGTSDFLGSRSGHAQAVANPIGDNLLKAYASGFSTYGGSFGPDGRGIGVAAWRDVISVNGVGPSQVRLSFELDGTWDVSSFGNSVNGGLAQSLVGVAASTNINDGFIPDYYPVYSRELRDHTAVYRWVAEYSAQGGHAAVAAYSARTSHGTTDPTNTSWDSVSLLPAEGGAVTFRGKLHVDVPYNVQLGGYYFMVALQATATGDIGRAEADFFNTMRLTSVTTMTGESLNVSFDSGLRLTSPMSEPATLSLSAIAIIFGAAVRRHRQRQHQRGQYFPQRQSTRQLRLGRQ